MIMEQTALEGAGVGAAVGVEPTAQLAAFPVGILMLTLLVQLLVYFVPCRN